MAAGKNYLTSSDLFIASSAAVLWHAIYVLLRPLFSEMYLYLAPPNSLWYLKLAGQQLARVFP